MVYIIDSIACIPFNLIELFVPTGRGGSYNKLLRLARLPRLYRLVRVFKIFKMSKIFKANKINPGLIKLAKVLCSVLLFFHLVACFWFYVSKYNNFDDRTWVFRIGVIDETNWYQYIKSLYWVLQTVTTIGYGDIGSKLPAEMLICCILIIFGVGFYSFVIGNLSTIMNDINQKSANLQDKINALTEFANKTKLPNSTVDKITKFFCE